LLQASARPRGNIFMSRCQAHSGVGRRRRRDVCAINSHFPTRYSAGWRIAALTNGPYRARLAIRDTPVRPLRGLFRVSPTQCRPCATDVVPELCADGQLGVVRCGQRDDSSGIGIRPRGTATLAVRRIHGAHVARDPRSCGHRHLCALDVRHAMHQALPAKRNSHGHIPHAATGCSVFRLDILWLVIPRLARGALPGPMVGNQIPEPMSVADRHGSRSSWERRPDAPEAPPR
jgi:hypothetical protein